MKTKPLALLTLSLLPTLFTPTFADLNNGLVAYYPFDDTAKDYSGNKHHGTIIGNVSFGEGKIGNAASFKSYVKNLNMIFQQ